MRQGKRIIVFDQPQQNRSSAIAAGLFNPITGKLMTRTWLADNIFPELHNFYQDAEKALRQQFFYPQSLYRPFLTIEEQNEWMGKSSASFMHAYVANVFSESSFGTQIHDPLGGVLLKQCGYLDVRKFMNSVSEELRNNQSYLEETFNDQLLEVNNDCVSYSGIGAHKIIFCCGTAQLKSSRFGNVPIRPLKGETLTVELEEPPELIFNRGVYIVPISQNRYRVGATYETRNLSESITEEGRMELQQKLMDLLKIPYRILGQDWGFRPTTLDRKPILGYYPESKNVVIFNGLGTKGVSLAPYFSAQVAEWLLGSGEIQPEVNIKRFKTLSSKSSEVV